MKYVIEHTFAGLSLPEFETLFFDEEFNVALSETLKLGRTLVRLDRTPDRIVRHTRCEPKREPGSAAAKLFGDKRAGWFEELEYDVGKFFGRWKTIPSVMTDKIESSGTVEFVAAPGGVRRIVKGEVTVSIFGVGRQIEKAIVAGTEKGYAAGVDFTATWVKNLGARRTA
jgi:hypothetical protein